MKKISAVRLMFTFAGCFLGAGYVSGQELWQFFGSFGKWGFAGIVLAITVLAVFGILLIRTAQMKNVSEMDKVVISGNSKILKGVFSFLEIFFLFGIYVVMTAGSGALLNQLFGLPQWIGNIAFTVIVTTVTFIGIRGMVTAFSLTVPIMVIMSLTVFIVSVSKTGFHGLSFDVTTNDNPLIINWFVSAIVFASYNLFSSIGILAHLGKVIDKRRTLCCGLAAGGMMLLTIAVCTLISLASDVECVKAELPILAKAGSLGTVFQYIFAFLLYCGMFGTSVSSVFGISEYVKLKKQSRKAGPLTIIISAVLSIAGSMAGFNGLISVVYPVCGYLGLVGMVLIVINYTKSRKTNSREVQNEQKV